MLVATSYLPVGIRGKVLGTFASTVAFAAAVGPILGGFIAGALNWHYLFLVILGSLAPLPSLLRLLPAEKKRPAAFDGLGAAFLGGGLGCLLFGLTTGTWWLFLPGLAALALFIRQVFLSPHPLVPPALFFNAPYRGTIAVTILAIGSVFGMMFTVPLMLRDTLGLDVTRIGLTLFPGAMSAAFLGTVGGLISDRRGSAFVATAGLALSIGGFALLSTFAGFHAYLISFILIVSYAGFSFLQSSLPHTAAAALPPELTGVGMGFYNLTFFMSGAFTSATIGRVLDLRPGWFCLNPLSTCVPGWPYSNVFFFLGAASAVALVIFRITFRGKKEGMKGRGE
jgi:DHA2 family metal-tetracycline-proton antiporter-like MFS transporter